MKQAFSDTFLLWLLLVAAAVIHIGAVLGIELPLIVKTTFWRLEQHPGITLGMATVVAITVLVMGFSQENKYALTLFIAGLYMGLGIVSFMFFDPGAGGAFTATSLAMYRRCKMKPYHDASNFHLRRR